ncbi:MAG: recombinase family protein [Thiobacillus sp.]
MKAAIYARKSTDDNDRDADNKSVTRQVEHARTYAKKQGWTVDDEHIFVDDGISGAEFKRRPGLLRMLNSLKQFDVLIMSELSRIGRDQVLTSSTLAQVEAASVKVHLYLTREELKFDSAIDRFIVSAANFAAELEREKASERSRDALERKARKGFNTGGRCYGYDNCKVEGSHTDYAINEQQAGVVRGIFRCYADGYGLVAVAKTLNGEAKYRDQLNLYFGGVCPPSPTKGSGSWAPSGIREMIRRTRYIGQIPFGEHRNVYKGGTKTREKQGEFMTTDRPDLRIIDDELWRLVQKRIGAVAATYARESNGEWWGRPETGAVSPYLLSGLMRCSVCGGSMVGHTWYSGTGKGRKPSRRYACSIHAKRGANVCSNGVRPPMAEVDDAVLSAIERTILTPEVVSEVAHRATLLATERNRADPDRKTRLTKELALIRRQLNNFMELVAQGKAPVSVLEEINRRESRITELERELAALALPMVAPSVQTLEKQFGERMGKFRELLRDDVTGKARQALRKLLIGSVLFVPTEDGWELRGETAFAALLPIRTNRTNLASPRGFEPRYLP